MTDSILRRLLPRRLRHPAETSRLIVGSTGSGKSEGELVDLVRLAGRRDTAVVLLDPHGPLALRTAGHWAARGHGDRLVYEPLIVTDRVLAWDMLSRSTADEPSLRRIEDAETRDDVVQCFLAERNLDTLTNRPWTKEWLEAAIDLCLSQHGSEPLGSLLSAFRIGSSEYERLLRNADRQDIVRKFREMESLRRKNVVQYELQTGPARRLLELICDSEIVRLRSRPGPFNWQEALQDRRLIIFDGGGIRSREIKRTVFLLASMEVIHAVRLHFAKGQSSLSVVLVLEEAGATGLVTPFVSAALQELRKAGLSIHIITQSAVDFGDRDLFQSLLANTPWQCWYQCLSAADQELGAKVLANAAFDPLAVHFTRTRHEQFSSERRETVTRGETFGPHGYPLLLEDRRTGTAIFPRFTARTEPHYKTPQLIEQEYRTMLATLRIGERIVRDRDGVFRQGVRRVKSPWLRPVTDNRTRKMIELLRAGPLYSPAKSALENAASEGAAEGAAARLRAMHRSRTDEKPKADVSLPARRADVEE